MDTKDRPTKVYTDSVNYLNNSNTIPTLLKEYPLMLGIKHDVLIKAFSEEFIKISPMKTKPKRLIHNFHVLVNNTYYSTNTINKFYRDHIDRVIKEVKDFSI